MKFIQTTTVLERGILTSAYKQEIKSNIRTAKRKSVSRVKSLIRNHQENIESETGVILKVALFFVAFVVITF